MPQQKYQHHHHREEHSKASEFIRDVIIGLSDGLTVPFAIAAGLAAGAVSHPSIIVAAGLAEIAAGSISMGLGGYLAAKTEADHYYNELKREELEVETKPQAEESEVQDIFKFYGLSQRESQVVTDSLKQRKKNWVDFMMKFELGLEEPNRRHEVLSALTIAFSYVAGGLIPLSPYIVLPNSFEALGVSIGVTFLALLLFGYLRGRFMATKPWRSTLETVLIGGLAATAAFILAKIVS